MKVIEIKVKTRKETGKKATKELRKSKYIPCVIYGGEKNEHFYAELSDFRALVYTPNSYIVNLDIEGTKKQAIMQDIQFHPVSDDILHIDFLEVNEENKITIGIPVKLEGFPVGVQSGGVLNLLKRRLKIKALMKNLPDILNIDVTELELGKSIKIAELDFENIDLLDPKDSVVCSVKLTRVAKGMEEAKEEGVVEGEEGETTKEGAEEAEKTGTDK